MKTNVKTENYFPQCQLYFLSIDWSIEKGAKLWTWILTENQLIESECTYRSIPFCDSY